jgi:putative aldouronate transport system substrate-binding protein
MAITSVKLTGIKLDKASLSLNAGESYSLKIAYTPSNATQKLLSFATSNKNVAAIDTDGRITGVGAGKATITVTSSTDKKISAKVTVTVTVPAPVTIDWLDYNTYAQPDPNSDVVKQVEKWTNLKFKFWYIDDQQWDQVLGVKLAAGEMPDVMRIKSTDRLPQYVKMGVLSPITEDILGKLPAVKKAYDDAAGGLNQNADATINGRLYCLKNINSNSAYPTSIVWRKDWLKNVGINKLPETLEEWQTAMERFTNGDPDKNGKKDTYGMSNTTMDSIFGAYGTIPLKEYRGKGTQNLFWTMKKGRFEFAAIQPEMKIALTVLQKWYKAGYIDPEFVTGENTGGYWAESQAFENGKVGVTGMAMAYHWNPPLFEGGTAGACLAAFQKVNPTATFGTTVDIGKAVVGPSGKSGSHCWGAVQNAGVGITTKLTKNSKKLDAFLNAYNMMTTDEAKYLYAAYGVKDVHYNIDPKSGNYNRIAPYNQAADQIKAGLTVLTGFNIPDFDKKATPLQTDWLDQYRTTGYSPILVPVVDSAVKYTADLQKLTLEAYVRIITGDKPVSYFDEFVKAFNTNGGTAITNEVNDAAGIK